MLSPERNAQLTQVSKGTPMGEMLRRYWYPIAGTMELVQEPTKAVRLLGEDLVLYRDRSGTLGLIGRQCPHRRISMEYGIPDENGLRCAYHGWLFNENGRCLDQPTESAESSYKDRICIAAYPVRALCGMIFAYLGPAPVPEVPGWDLLVREDLVKEIVLQVIDCNWVQIMENSVDPYHTEYLHGMQTLYRRERLGLDIASTGDMTMLRHKKIGFDRYERGIIKRRVLEGQTEEDEGWRIGHPVVFPNILKVTGHGRNNMQFRVPMDDTHTYHVRLTGNVPAEGEAPTPIDAIPVREGDVFDEKTKRFKVATNKDFAQDVMAWVTAGPIMDRSQENLGSSDKGVVLFRHMLEEQMELVANGGEPMNVFHNPAEAAFVEIAAEEDKYSAVVPESGKRVTFGAFGIYNGDEYREVDETAVRESAKPAGE